MENTIQYELTPKKVKNIIIRVKANGVVAVTMPYRMSKKKVDAFVQSKAEWIRMMQKKLANQQRIDVDALEWNRQKEQYLRNLEQVEVQVLYMMYRNYDAVFYTTAEARYEFMLKFFDMAQKLNVNALMENGKSLEELRADALDN